MLLPARTYAQDTALVDLDRRSIGEAKNGMRSAAGPQVFALRQLVAGGELTIA